MPASDAEKWAKFSKLGRKQYVLRYGVLGWGIPTAFFFCLGHGFLNGWDAFWAELIPAFILFPLGGIFFGRFMWRMLEKKHAATPAPHATK